MTHAIFLLKFAWEALCINIAVGADYSAANCYITWILVLSSRQVLESRTISQRKTKTHSCLQSKIEVDFDATPRS